MENYEHAVILLDDDDYEFIKTFNYMDQNKLYDYVNNKYIYNEDRKIFMKKMKKKIYIHLANIKFNDLDFLNNIIEHHDYYRQDTLKDAINIIKNNIFINIYDILDHNYDNIHESINKLKKYSITNKKIFPLKEAKSLQLKTFLRNFFT